MEINSIKLVEDLTKKSDQKQANNITVLDIQGISVIADYFMIMDVRNTRMMDALVKDLTEEAEKDGYPVKRIEGKEVSEWVLLDFGDVVVHIFTPEKREFYNLDRLWIEANKVDVNQWLDINV
ncbi:ribosome silencing factor [Xylocopilactobacillus apis]|uniref:Ribosomal silencing factor RsfS n=1 Tax=Xylocopilactobacillus apis TaxID=2932183 RepID=A0AAU9DMU0_9LACO|nr:ribosome silencing factor [Xylocopilactobacillus apis]BDR56228.1 ribosomal silencing factor RsfS [Xylocopilactobacillus apis]